MTETKTKLVKRTVKNKVHTFFEETEGIKPDGSWGTVTVENQAHRGDEIEITEAQARLGDKHAAFFTDAELKAIASRGESVGDTAPPAPPVGDVIDLAAMDSEATVAWLKGEGDARKPSIPQVLNAVNSAPEAEREDVAKRVLEAEKQRGDSDPRVSLVTPLEEFLAEPEED
jgi:hypothetical protein